jgi:hypothetical protein
MPRSTAVIFSPSRSRCYRNSTTFQLSRKRRQRPSNESGRRVGTTCGASPIHSIQQSPSGSSAGFPSEEEVVIALVGFDQKTIGDVFYASAVVRGEALVDAGLRQKGDTDDRRS